MEITKKHQIAIGLLFEGDLKRSEVADQLKVTERTLYNWLKDKDFSQAYDDYVKLMLSKSTGKALNTMLSLLNARSEMVKFNAAKDILDRGGIVPDGSGAENININIVNDVLEIGDG